MRIGIIGGGITGLTAAYRLSQKGHQITLFEKENFLGGLSAGFKKEGWTWHLEDFFHHLFTSDQFAKSLITELGLSSKLFYRRPKTSIFQNNSIVQFDSPSSVLAFPYLSPFEKIRAGLVTSYLKTTNEWLKLEKITAPAWLKKHYGPKTYQTLWQPLLKGKFASEADRVAMSWFWARIKKRSSRLGYLRGGFSVLINRLAEQIKRNHGKILLNSEWKGESKAKFDRLIFTVPCLTFLELMAKKLPLDYREKLKKLKMIGVLNLILSSKRKFLTEGSYWLNINESSFPFVALVEQTNFVDPKYYNNNHLLYLGGYYPRNHPYFKMSPGKILKEFLPYLKKIKPKSNPVLDFQLIKLSTNLFAQPMVTTNYSKKIPSMKTPLPNIYLANMQMVYPWDRGINYAIELGETVADEVLS